MPALVQNISGVIFLVLIAISGFAAGNTVQISQTKSEDSIPKLWGTTQTKPGPEEWQASWIWIKGETSGTDLVLLARKQFILAALPKQARLFITADNNYELYVNGQFVNRGPVRCQPHHQSYDIIEIASLLKEGENVLALRALHQGRFGSYNTPPRPGILAQLEVKTDTKIEIIKSDSSWKVKKPEGTNLNSPIFGELIDRRDDIHPAGRADHIGRHRGGGSRGRVRTPHAREPRADGGHEGGTARHSPHGERRASEPHRRYRDGSARALPPAALTADQCQPNVSRRCSPPRDTAAAVPPRR